MVATIEKPLQHLVLPNITWETFERILDEIGERHFRVAYLNGDLEFMTISFEHDSFGRWIGRMIFFVAYELNLSLCTGGSTTLKQGLLKVGLEPDECFWVQHEKDMRGKKKWKAGTNPPPDLAVEIDISSSWVDRLEIYAALKVPEIWRFDGETLRVLILGPAGKYKVRTKSVAFPMLPMDGFSRQIKKLGTTDEITLIQEFTEWLRLEVVGKKSGDERKNGRR